MVRLAWALEGRAEPHQKPSTSPNIVNLGNKESILLCPEKLIEVYTY